MDALIPVLKFSLCAAAVVGIVQVEVDLIDNAFQSRAADASCQCPTLLTGIKNAESKKVSQRNNF